MFNVICWQMVCGLVYGVQHHFYQYFSYIVAVSFTGRGNLVKTTDPSQVTD
jgi:hypothetical protein